MNFLKNNKLLILILFFLLKIFSFSNDLNIMEINIIDLDGIYSNKILNDLKFPLKKILFLSDGKIISEQYIERKNKIHEKEQKEIGNYDIKELKSILNNIFLNQNLEDYFSIYCEECKIFGTEITGLEIHYGNSKVYKYIFENEKEKKLFVNGKKTYVIGKIFEIKYDIFLIYLYESGDYYENGDVKKLIDFINDSLGNIPEIEKIKKKEAM